MHLTRIPGNSQSFILGVARIYVLKIDYNLDPGAQKVLQRHKNGRRSRNLRS